MSGIAGIFHIQGISNVSAIIDSMGQKLAHRGPGGQAVYKDDSCALVWRREASCTTTPSTTPLVHPQTGHVLIFDGCIYNAATLSTELLMQGHNLGSGSDPEVVLAAYQEWGTACFAQFKGMFACALWEPATRTLVLARDHMGQKPLVYTWLPDGSFIFASEIKALLCHPHVVSRVHAIALDRLLDYGFNLAPDSFIQGIQHIMPATYAIIDRQGMRSNSYWSLDLDQPVQNLSRSDATWELSAHLGSAVRRCLHTDTPLLAYLSGGIDSSSVTARYAQITDDPVHTLSITFTEAGYDESHYARQVAKAIGSLHHEFQCAIAEDEITKLIWHLETPLVTLLHLPLYLLSRQARDLGFSAVLSGDGADEILGGYDYFKLIKLMPFIARQESPFRANLLRRIYPQLTAEQAWTQYQIFKTYPCPHPALPYRFQAFQLKNQLLCDDLLDQLAACQEQRHNDLPQVPGHRPLLDQALFLETRMRLPNLTLPLGDTMSMANAVQVHAPFMDHTLLEYLFSLPAHYKMQGLREKHLLKRSSRTILPPQICARRKQPLSPPGAWFVRTFRTLIGDTLAPDTTRAKGYFRPEFIEFMLREFDAGSRMDYSGVLVVAFFIHLWDSLFIQRSGSNSH